MGRLRVSEIAPWLIIGTSLLLLIYLVRQVTMGNEVRLFVAAAALFGGAAIF